MLRGSVYRKLTRFNQIENITQLIFSLSVTEHVVWFEVFKVYKCSLACQVQCGKMKDRERDKRLTKTILSDCTQVCKHTTWHAETEVRG